MKTLLRPLCAALLCASTSFAQVVPTTPTDFATRRIGDASSGGSAGISSTQPKNETTFRHIAYISLGEPRQWTSSDGKPLVAKLIAWEQSEQVTTQGQPAPEPAMPELPNGPTVVRDEKIRLLVNNKPFELPLARLSETDQAFIAQVVSTVTKTPPPASEAGTGTK